jgi:hypothetical protein
VLRSLVFKIEYRRALHQNVIPASCPPVLPSSPATDKPSISSVPAAFLPGLPRAFSAKGSVCSRTFPPGSSLQVENDVTHSKQMIATFLPGATATCKRLAFRDGFVCSRPFLTGSGSQTELPVTHSKQTTGTFLTGSRIARHRALSARNSQPINAWEYEECSASPRAEACDGKMS